MIDFSFRSYLYTIVLRSWRELLASITHLEGAEAGDFEVLIGGWLHSDFGSRGGAIFGAICPFSIFCARRIKDLVVSCNHGAFRHRVSGLSFLDSDTILPPLTI